MNLLGATSYCLGLQVHHFPGGVFLHQQAYVRKLLKYFQMDQAHALVAPMIGRSYRSEDPYQPCSEEEEIVDRQKYLTAVGAFTYMTTHTRPDIAFATNILARHNQKSTARHWNGVKNIYSATYEVPKTSGCTTDEIQNARSQAMRTPDSTLMKYPGNLKPVTYSSRMEHQSRGNRLNKLSPQLQRITQNS
jgi:hypothetical protein